MTRMRQRIAQRLKDSQNTYAMLTTFNEVDMRFVSVMVLVGSQALANLRAWLWLFRLRSYWPIVGLITVNNSKFLPTWQFSELLC